MKPLYVLYVDPHSRDHLPQWVDWDGTVLDLDALQRAQLQSSQKRDHFLLGDTPTAILSVQTFFSDLYFKKIYEVLNLPMACKLDPLAWFKLDMNLGFYPARTENLMLSI